ncbi:hypothetical protein CBL_13953 [Carabus blaptoides fortunei]
MQQARLRSTSSRLTHRRKLDELSARLTKEKRTGVEYGVGTEASGIRYRRGYFSVVVRTPYVPGWLKDGKRRPLWFVVVIDDAMVFVQDETVGIQDLIIAVL